MDVCLTNVDCDDGKENKQKECKEMELAHNRLSGLNLAPVSLLTGMPIIFISSRSSQKKDVQTKGCSIRSVPNEGEHKKKA